MSRGILVYFWSIRNAFIYISIAFNVKTIQVKDLRHCLINLLKVIRKVYLNMHRYWIKLLNIHPAKGLIIWIYGLKQISESLVLIFY